MNNDPNLARRHLLALPLAMAAGCSTAAAPPAGGRQAEWATPAALTLSATLRHWLYLPPGYAEHPEQRWPLIVFLHGSGERGADLGKVRAHGLPKLIEAGQQYPALVVSPQCEDGDDWDAHLLHAMLATLLRQWRIDPQRVTATGLSMGGGGCWSWAMSYPQDLAGIAPVCGYGSRNGTPTLPPGRCPPGGLLQRTGRAGSAQVPWFGPLMPS